MLLGKIMKSLDAKARSASFASWCAKTLGCADGSDREALLLTHLPRKETQKQMHVALTSQAPNEPGP